jgi:hypothetical protein
MPLSIPHISTGQLVTAAWLSSVADGLNSILMSASGQEWQGYLRTTQVGPHAIGIAADANYQLMLGGTYAGSATYAGGANFITTLTPAVGASAFGLRVWPTITEAASGTHPEFASLVIHPPTVNAAAATVTTAESLRIVGAPTNGVANYAMHVVSGNVRVNQKIALNYDGSSAFMTTGVMVNQGSNTDEAIALKASGVVAHGITAAADTDTYGTMSILSGTDGGMKVRGISEGIIGLDLKGSVSNADTTKTAASNGAINISSSAKSGTGLIAIATANSNLLVVRNEGAGARFILDIDGDSHQDVGTAWTNFDDHEDVELLHALSVGVSHSADPLRHAFGAFLDKHRDVLERERIVTFNEDGHHFVNWSRTHMLTIGAVRQLGMQVQALKTQLRQIEANHA